MSTPVPAAPGSGSMVTSGSPYPGRTVSRAAQAGMPGPATGTWQSLDAPISAAPMPRRCTVPAAGPPTARTSTTPDGSSSTVPGAACWSAATTAPSCSTAAAGAAGSSGLAFTHRVPDLGWAARLPQPAPLAPGSRMTSARSSRGGSEVRSPAATCATVRLSSPPITRSRGPCGVSAVSVIRICRPLRQAQRWGCGGGPAAVAGSAAGLPPTLPGTRHVIGFRVIPPDVHQGPDGSRCPPFRVPLRYVTAAGRLVTIPAWLSPSSHNGTCSEIRSLSHLSNG